MKKLKRGWEIAFLILGAPIWLSLLIAVFAIILSLYISLWSIIISFWGVFVSLLVSGLSFIIIGIVFAAGSSSLTGIALMGAGITCTGLCILAFYVCKAITKGIIILTKKIAIGIKNCFIRKENP